ncbi:mammalian cell entry protein [Mycobacterium sp.]|uniref:mammalian cell entry protein n=1 Tax=Mycobacterium sp. TaxID=1785 RepID=UPI0039C9A724
MSPLRKFEPGADELLKEVAPKPPLRWRLPVVMSLAALLIAGAIAAGSLLLVSHESHRRAEIKDVAVLGYVREFMTEYTSLDPFHANDYADKILAQGTGDFAKSFKERENEILISVARSEPTKGTVTEAGVQKWNGDGSANVLVAIQSATTSSADKKVTESGSRWLATAIKEGQQWKISQLMQVI